MMQEQDMLLFLVYKMLHKKFSTEPQEQQEDEGNMPDHMREKKQDGVVEKQRVKEEYINNLLQAIQERNRPKPLPLAPVINPEV